MATAFILQYLIAVKILDDRFVELPPGAVHTFVNNTNEDTLWVTGWLPKGFERFFSEFGNRQRSSERARAVGIRRNRRPGAQELRKARHVRAQVAFDMASTLKRQSLPI
jgi:hypothetical protein